MKRSEAIKETFLLNVNVKQKPNSREALSKNHNKQP